MMYQALDVFIKKLNQDQSTAHQIRAKSSLLMLEHIDVMLEYYQKTNAKAKGEILLDVFGLLQGLFVAIDALYDLSIGITSFKYHININQNPILHELKYIRNDIVGHPTNRTYQNGYIGFSMIDEDSISKESISYQTYVYKKNEVKKQTRQVFFKSLIENYHQEKTQTLKGLLEYLNQKGVESKLPDLIYHFYETRNIEVFKEIKIEFDHLYPNATSNNRFVWRYELVQMGLKWTEKELEYQSLIRYVLNKQILKLYEISMDFFDQKREVPYVKIPKILQRFYKFIAKNEGLIPYLDVLNDLNHPAFATNVEVLLKASSSDKVTTLIEWFKSIQDERQVYLIGSAFKAYVKRH